MKPTKRTFVSLAVLTLTLTGSQAQEGMATRHVLEPTRPIERAPQASQAPFQKLDQVRGASIDLLFAPLRPMAMDPGSQRLYALNTHNNTVLEYRGNDTLRTMPVPWGPVSLALWQAPGSSRTPLLLVVCRGSYTLACIDLNTGSIVRLIDLPNEPADILVHPRTKHVFISCAGDESVVEIALPLGQILARHVIPAKQPSFLALDGDDVLVAPMLSGNNSISGKTTILDLEDPRLAIQGLKDHDLFRIDAAGTVSPVATAMGSVLFGLALHPTTGELWQLGTEAKNKNPLLQSEPDLRGDFVQNRVSLADLSPGNLVKPKLVIDLDDTDRSTPGVQFDATRSVGQPYALAFDAQGAGYVAGLLSQNVTQLSAHGDFMREWNVGSIPRAILVDPSGENALVYCWGDNLIEHYDLRETQPLKRHSLSLGFDPTPAEEREGRKLFYDASFSMHGNASCATCHVETETDMLVWNLSDLPFDDKGPLVTQTMKGIRDAGPLHWRGERATLADFNGAFDGLLGGRQLDETPGGEFDHFQAFIFSLEQPANPGTHASRLVDGSPDGNGGDAVRGQDIFFSDDANQGLCSSCHVLPTGSNSEMQRAVANPSGVDRRAHVKVPTFNGLWRKEQPTLNDVILADGRIEPRPTNGSGLTATGSSDNLLEFLREFFTLTGQEEFDLLAFLNQLDSGLAPAVHRSWLLNRASETSVGPILQSYLLNQAARGNADIAVFGRLGRGMESREVRWFWDRVTGMFLAEDSSVPARGLSDFVAEVHLGQGSWVFLGLPVGYAQRFAVDFDADELFNLDELSLGSNPELADSDFDGFPDGHEVANGGAPLDAGVGSSDARAPRISNLRLVYRTSRVAKLQFDTDEPTRMSANWSTGASASSTSSARFEKSHSVLLTNLRYKLAYSAAVTATDLGGNATTLALPGNFRALSAQDPFALILGSLSTQVTENAGGVLQVSMTGLGQAKSGGRPNLNTRLEVRVFVNGVLSQSLKGNTSGSDGISTVNIREEGLSPGDRVRVLVDALGILPWNMPETIPANRERTLIYDGSGS